MNNKLLSVFLCGFVLLGLNCLHTDAIRLDSSTQYPPVPSEEVRIFTTEEELEKFDYVKVAVITSKGDSNWTRRVKMIESMREKAGSLGANAILLPNFNEPGAGTKLLGAVLGQAVYRRAEVIAYRIIERI